jgi:hypothetical protein
MLRVAAGAFFLAAVAWAGVGEPARSAPGCHPNRSRYVAVNLDRDPARENVSSAEETNCAHTHQSASVTIQDRCRGRWNTFSISGAFLNFADTPLIDNSFRIVEADGATRRPEVFLDVAGFTPNGRKLGLAKVVRLDRRARDGCSAPKTLFAYSTSGYSGGPGRTLVRWDAQLVDADGAWPGLEVVLTETTAPEGGNPLSRRVRQYRYDRGAGRYLVYKDETTEPR